MAAAAAEPLDNQLKGEPKEVNLEEPETELDFLALFCVLAAMHFGNVVHVPGLMKYRAPLTQTSVDSNGQPLQQLTVEQMRSLVNTHRQAIAGRVASAQDMQNIGLHVRTAKKLFLTREKDRMVFKVGTQFFIGNKDKVTDKKRKSDAAAVAANDVIQQRMAIFQGELKRRKEDDYEKVCRSPEKDENGLQILFQSDEKAIQSAKKMRPTPDRLRAARDALSPKRLNGATYSPAEPVLGLPVQQPPGQSPSQALNEQGRGDDNGDDLTPFSTQAYTGTADELGDLDLSYFN